MTGQDLEQKVEGLAREIVLLREKVDALSRAMAGSGAPHSLQVAAPTVAESGDAGEELLSWVGESSLLPRTAATCFLLVAALVLRTLTDNDLLDARVGSLLGMAYAASLIALGWEMYRRNGLLAPIFTVCGTVLMYVIVIETHARFASLSSLSAYVILLVTGAAAATISYLYSRALPVLMGTLGMGIAAVAIDYPAPYFPHLALLLLVANLFAAYATRLRSCSWLRWLLLGLLAVMMQVWALKISLVTRRLDLNPISLGAAWFLPVLILSGVAVFAVAVWAAIRPRNERVSRFDLALPTVSALWVFAAAAYVLRTEPGQLLLLGLIGVIVGSGFFALAGWLRREREGSSPSVLAYVTAASLLLGVGTAFVSGGMLAPLVVLSLTALGLAALAGNWKIGGVRLFAYLLQIGSAATLALVLLDMGPATRPAPQALAALGLAGFGLWQYLICRRTPLSVDSFFFSRIDQEDRSAVLLLLGSLMGGFLLLRIGLYQGLAAFLGDPVEAFKGGQSVIISSAAAVLMMIAFFGGRNREIRNTAILITFIAAGKVFFQDLFGIRGVPLVMSVFSFGLTVSVISLALTRWKRSGRGLREERTAPDCRAEN